MVRPKNPKILSGRDRVVSDSGLPLKRAHFLVSAALLLALSFCPALAEEYRSPADGIRSMTYEEGRLSLDAKDASLDKSLSELSRMAMLTIIADGPIEARVTVYTDRLPLERALRKILKGKDTSFVYTAKAQTSPPEYEIAEVRIYVAEAQKGETRRYSYSRNRGDRARAPSPPGLSGQGARSRGSSRRTPRTPPPVPPIANSEDAQRLITELMEGNLDGLQEIAEELKEQNPQVEDQIEELLETLEHAKERAGEGGTAIPPLEGLGNMQEMMNQMLNRGRMSPEDEDE
jgi:hypothetical protein